MSNTRTIVRYNKTVDVTSTAFREHTYISQPSFPINVFQVRAPNPLIIPPHWHEYVEWMLVRSGTFRVQLESGFRDLGPGNAVFVAPGRVHAAFPLGEGTDILAVVFDETLIRSAALDDSEIGCAIPLLRGDVPTAFALGPEDEASARIARALSGVEAEFFGRKPGYELFVKAALVESLAELFRSSGETRARGGGPIAAFLRRLCLDYMESVSVDEAAAECGLSRSYFCHAFKKATGKPLIEYLHTLRVIEAERLLANTDLPIRDIATIVGFESPAYFGRVFRALRGRSPREARGTATPPAP